MLSEARALLRLDSPYLTWKIQANQFVAQLVRTSLDGRLPLDVRDRSKRARKALDDVPHLRSLAPDMEKPWQPGDIGAAREKEWKAVFEGRRRKPPLAGRGKAKLPWGLHLLPPWTRPLVARYFLATFPIIEKRETVDGKNKYLAAVKTPAEVKALRSLRQLHMECRGERGDLDEVRYALEVLREGGKVEGEQKIRKRGKVRGERVCNDSTRSDQRYSQMYQEQWRSRRVCGAQGVPKTVDS